MQIVCLAIYFLSLSATELHHDDCGADPVHQRAGWYDHSARGEDRREGPERQHASLPAAALLRSSQRGKEAAFVSAVRTLSLRFFFFFMCDFQINCCGLCFLVTGYMASIAWTHGYPLGRTMFNQIFKIHVCVPIGLGHPSIHPSILFRLSEVGSLWQQA